MRGIAMEPPMRRIGSACDGEFRYLRIQHRALGIINNKVESVSL